MRKWIALLIFIGLCFGAVYLFIPSKISVVEKMALPVNAKALSRVFFTEQNWQQWWPGEKAKSLTYPIQFGYNRKTYTLLQKRFSSYVISVAEDGDSLVTEMVLLPLQNGTMEASWLATTVTSANLFTRISQYRKIKKLTADFSALLGQLKSFYDTDERLYGFTIREVLVADSLLVSTAQTTKTPLPTESIYAMIDRLKTFVQKNGARQTAPPMLNIFRNTEGDYTTRVALPVSKRLPDEGDIQFKWMLGNGNILTTDIKGGPAQIQKAFDQMQNFIDDNRRTAPAIEFQSLITDRRAETDTSKWVTKLYWPVM